MLFATLCLALVFAEPLVLDRVLDEVQVGAPAVVVAAQDVEVAEAEVRTRWSWQDPRIALGTSGIALPGRPRPPMGTTLSYRVEQTFDTLARRRPARAEARAQIGVHEQRLRRSEWDAKAEAVELFMRVWAIDASDALYHRQLAVLDETREAALAMYSAGLPGGHHDVLRAEAEIFVVRAALASLADERMATVAMLNTLRGRDPEEPIDAVALPTLSAPRRLAALVEQRTHVPEAREAQAQLEASHARRRLARGRYVPMLTLGLQYEQRLFGMPDSLGGMVSMTVPLWSFDSQAREVDLADAMVRRAEVRARAVDALTNARARVAWSRAQAARRRLEVLEGEAIPRMKETLSSSRAAYVSGTGSFLTVLDTRLAIQGLEEQRIDATVGFHVACFEIDRVLGTRAGSEAAQ